MCSIPDQKKHYEVKVGPGKVD